METLMIDRFAFDKLVIFVYKNTLPSDHILKYGLKLLFNINIETIKNKIIKSNNVTYNHDYEKVLKSDCFIYERVSFFNKYAPLLNFYKNKNINYQFVSDKDINLNDFKYINIEEYNHDLCLLYNLTDNLSEIDNTFIQYINGIKKKDKYFVKILYILKKYPDLDADYAIDFIKTPRINLILKF